MKKLLVFILFIFVITALPISSTTVKVNAQVGQQCEWLSLWCQYPMTWEAICVNVGGNTNTACNCGAIEDCDNHDPIE